jgi:tetratricopeptide (TPR) repeat protein
MMGRIEKTVFISYRRTNYWTALAIFQNLHANGYDVFFDYKSIPSGDFEQAIVENIKSRAHFVVILSPSALERCNEPGDWLRREMETAIDNQRNIIPLIMEGFDFGSPSTLKALTGKLDAFKKYNGLGVPAEYFEEAMTKLRSERFLNKPLESVSHPVADITKQITEEQKSTANEADQVETHQLTAEELFERAYTQKEVKNYDEAIRYYMEAIQLEPDLVAAHNNLGNLLSALKRNDEAEAAYRKAIELNPSYDSAYYNLGNFLSDLKRYDEAEAAYRKAIELKPTLTEAYSNLGVLLRDLKRNDESEAAFHKAIELNPSDDKAYCNLGVLLSDLKRNDEAETAYHKAIELNPAYDTAYYNLGLLLHENLKRYNEAEAAYRKAIELNPSLTEAYSNLGNLLSDLKRNDEAEAAYRKAIELNPAYDAAYSNLGKLLLNTKRYEKALAAYRKAIELNPSNFILKFLFSLLDKMQ